MKKTGVSLRPVGAYAPEGFQDVGRAFQPADIDSPERLSHKEENGK